MYSQQEIDDAVAAGVVDAKAADALRAHVAGQRATAIPDEEQFRLLTGFNDIFVAIAAAILLFSVGWIGQSAGMAAGLVVENDGPSFLAPLAVAGTAWALALFFTARRRMALPSIMLLLAFVIGTFLTTGFALADLIGPDQRGHVIEAAANLSPQMPMHVCGKANLVEGDRGKMAARILASTSREKICR